jgi:hypothetical protein
MRHIRHLHVHLHAWAYTFFQKICQLAPSNEASNCICLQLIYTQYICDVKCGFYVNNYDFMLTKIFYREIDDRQLIVKYPSDGFYAHL